MARKDKEKLFIEEIKIIQDVIKRMADNSFKIKGWAVTLIVIALIFKSNTNMGLFVAFIPLFCFWLLDAYYIRMERIYRKMYEWTIANRNSTDEFLFDLNSNRFEDVVDGYAKTMISMTLRIFYGSLLIILLIFSAIELWGGK